MALKSLSNEIGTLSKAKARMAIYARYSSDMQSPDSANDQIDRIKYYTQRKLLRLLKYPIDRYEIEIIDEWILKDEAESGRVADRQGYEFILDGIRELRFDILVVDDLSRLTRSLGDQIELYNLLKFKGIELYSICEGISSEASNAKTFFQIKGMVNELGNDINALRTRRGQEARVLKGFSAGDAPYGYDTNPTQTRMQGGREIPSHYEITVNLEQAKVVNMIYDWFLAGWGRPAIARELNKRKIPSSKRSQIMSGKLCNWNSTPILGILQNQKYIGIWKWGKTKTIKNPETKKSVRIENPENEWIEHLEGRDVREDLIIVDIDKWKRVQEKLKKRKDARQRNADAMQTARDHHIPAGSTKHLLTGIVNCGVCGGPMCLVNSRYYGCFTYHRKDPTMCSNNRTVKKAKIEPPIIKEVLENLSNQEHLTKAATSLNDRIRQRMRVTPEEIKRLTREQGNLEKEIANLLDFVSTHGNLSQAIKDNLDQKEKLLAYTTQRLRYLKSVKLDKILVTPYLLEKKVQDFSELIEKDPVRANPILRHLIPDGLACIPTGDPNAKQLNQWNSGWRIEGNLAISPDLGFSNMTDGGPQQTFVEPICLTIKIAI